MAKFLEDERRRLQSGAVQTQPMKPNPKAQTPVQTQAAAPAAAEKQTYTAPKAPAEKQTAAPAATKTTTTPAQSAGGDVVAQAQQYLNQQLGGYKSKYGSQITDLVQQFQSRPAFEYDIGTDPVYLQLRDQWTRDGLMAMEDTMGQAAQLTGGYGNSHAQMAGQQVYNDHMRQLGEMVPELKEAARADYDADTDALLRQYGLLMEQDSTDYARWMDEISRQRQQEELEYQRGRDELADQRYEDELKYQQGRDELADQRYQEELAYGREQDQYQRQQQSYDRLLQLIITTGYKPSAEELAVAGMTEAEAKAWRGYYTAGQSSGGGSGGGGGGNPKPTGDPAPKQEEKPAGDPAPKQKEKLTYDDIVRGVREMLMGGAGKDEVIDLLNDGRSSNAITEAQYQQILRKYFPPMD